MKIGSARVLGGLLCALVTQPVALGGGLVRLVRSMPEAYVPGRTMTILLQSAYLIDSAYLYADVYETLPEGWVVVDSDWSSRMTFDGATRTIHWEIRVNLGIWLGTPWPLTIRYDVMALLDRTGEVSFDGRCQYAFRSSGPRVLAGTTGDETLSSRVGVPRRVPLDFSTIQGAVDASLFGDTVLVSERPTPYIEDIEMKQGVDLTGESSYFPPVIQGTGAAIRTVPHTKIQGFHITSGGISAGRAVQISNCLITGIGGAAIYFTSSQGRVSNCTVVGNVYGVYAGSDRPDVLVTNCVFRDNGSPDPIAPFPRDGFADVSGAHVTFSCLEDTIYMGSEHNNIYAEPMFYRAEDGVYTLMPGSPCIDAGNNSVVSPSEKDLAGNPRIMFGGTAVTVDMGAYEHPERGPHFDAVTKDFRLTWSSTRGKTYSVFFSSDLLTWHLTNQNVPATGNMTLWLDPIGSLPELPMRFYRAMQNE